MNTDVCRCVDAPVRIGDVHCGHTLECQGGARTRDAEVQHYIEAVQGIVSSVDGHWQFCIHQQVVSIHVSATGVKAHLDQLLLLVTERIQSPNAMAKFGILHFAP